MRDLAICEQHEGSGQAQRIGDSQADVTHGDRLVEEAFERQCDQGESKQVV